MAIDFLEPSVYNQFLREKNRIQNLGFNPIFHKHLDSYEKFVDWKQKHDALFDPNDKAKGLI